MQLLVLAERRDVRILPRKVSGVSSLDFKLSRDARVQKADLRPKGGEPLQRYIGITQQREG